MSKLMLYGSYGSALDQIKYNEIFSPVVRGDYANTMIFTPPVNQEKAILKAIESLYAREESTRAQDQDLQHGVHA